MAVFHTSYAEEKFIMEDIVFKGLQRVDADRFMHIFHLKLEICLILQTTSSVIKHYLNLNFLTIL